MFYRLVQASEAMREADVRLVPALSSCQPCQTVQVIASPVLGACPVCGSELVVLSSDSLVPAKAEERRDRTVA